MWYKAAFAIKKYFFKRMPRSIAWFCFLAIVAAISIWFMIRAGSAAHFYLRLSQITPITIEKWEVKEIGKDRYIVSSNYFFTYHGNPFSGVGSIGPVFPNPWAAERYLSRNTKQNWTAWFNPKNPSFSVLEKHVPYKQVISAMIILILAIYFFSLGIYMRLKNEQG